MVVGLGDAGKTTLVHQLLTDKFSPNQFLMTDGVSMKEWKPTPQMNFSLWDFGGQQMYLNTHAMLLPCIFWYGILELGQILESWKSIC
jgi:GTPase SAR1 family protein